MTEEPVGPQQATTLLAEVESTGNRLHFHWGLGNEIFCCSTLNKDAQSAISVGIDSDQVSTSTCIRWGHLGAVHRRIAYDTCSKYMEYASMKQMGRKKGEARRSLTDTGASQGALAFAQIVSDILGANTLYSTHESDDTVQVLEEKALWELICSFVFDSLITEQSSGTIPDISSWYKANATALQGGVDQTPISTELIELMQHIDVPELEDRYWATFLRLVSLGWISDALDFLGLHTAWLQWDPSTFEQGLSIEGSNTPPEIIVLENISSILRRFPTLRDRGAAGPSMTRQFDALEELMSFRQAWLKKCLDLKNDSEMWKKCDQTAPETSKACLECLKILLGEENAMKRPVMSWCELLIAKLAHKYPDLHNLSELRHMLETCLVQLPSMNELQDSVASVIRSSCEMNHQGIIKACSFTVSDWFLGHITAVLEAHPSGPGPLKHELLHAGGDQSEFYRLDYANSLSPSPLTWELAAKYFGFCESHGKRAFEKLLDKLPLTTDGKLAHRAVILAETYGIEHLKYSVYKRQGALCWQNGLYGLGAQWFSLADDINSMDVSLGGIVFDAGDDQSLTEGTSEKRLHSIEQCIRSLRVPTDLEYAANLALITTKICADKKTKGSFELAMSTIRRVDRRLGIKCAQHLMTSVFALEPGYLDREDLVLFMEYINASEGENVALSRRKLLELVALLDIRSIC